MRSDQGRDWFRGCGLLATYDSLTLLIADRPCADSYIERAKLYWVRPNFELMMSDAESALRVEPREEKAIIFRSYVATFQEEGGAQKRIPKEVAAASTLDADSHYFLAVTLALQGDLRESYHHAIEAQRMGLHGPIKADAFHLCGGIEEELGRYDQSIQSFEEAILHYPLIRGFEWFEWDAGECRFGQSRVCIASKDYERALHSAEAWYEDSNGTEDARIYFARILATCDLPPFFVPGVMRVWVG